MSVDGRHLGFPIIDPEALEAVKRQERFPLPHNRLGLKLLRWVTRPLVWYQNRDVTSVGRTVDRTIPGPAGRRWLDELVARRVLRLPHTG